jgi:DNA-binding NarL/FixJ family response regulator
MSKFRIILADDHTLFRAGIKRILQDDPNLSVIGEAGDGLELLDLLEQSTPDLIILDISMPRLQGLEAIELIKGLYPDVKILILTMHKSRDYVYRAMESGADGYVIKEDANDVLRSAIETLRRDETFISPLIFG